MNEEEFKFIRNNKLFKFFSDSEISFLTTKIVREKFNRNQTIFTEGEQVTDLYIIESGAVDVMKWDPDHCETLILSTITEGEPFGEISFLDNSIRSATIKSIKETTVLKLSKSSFSTEKDGPLLTKLFANIALVNATRLRSLDELYSKKLATEQIEFNIQKKTRTSFLYLYLIFGFSLSFGSLISQQMGIFLCWFLALGPGLWIIKKRGFSTQQFGLQFKNWEQVLIASLSVIGVIILFVSIFQIFNTKPGEFALIHWVPHFKIEFPELLLFLPYAFAQELFARGILQTLLQSILDDKSGYKSAFILSFFLSIGFFYFGFLVGLTMLFISCALSLFYAQTRTILGTFIIHYFLLASGLIAI